MPIYEYECDACGHRFELIQKFSDPLVEICPKCGEKQVHKLLSSPAIKFKGSGFYINDYARKGGDGSESSKSAGSNESKSDDKSSSDKGSSDKSSSDKSSSDKTSSTASGTSASSSPSSSTDKAPAGSSSKHS